MWRTSKFNNIQWMWCLCVYINWWQTVWDTSITFNFTSSNGEFGIVFFYSYFIRREIFVVDFFCVFVFEVCIYWIDNIYLIRIVNVGVYMCRWCQQYLWLHVRKKHIFIYFVFVYFVCTLIGFFLFVFGFCSFGKHMRNKRWGKKR